MFCVRDERVKERLLRESDLTLQKVLDICKAAEATKEQVQAMNKEAMKVLTLSIPVLYTRRNVSLD